MLVYLVVWFGNMCLFISLKENGFDILMKIRNGLNILDIVCMKDLYGELDVEFEFCKYLFSNKLLNIDFLKIDRLGWNIVYNVFLFNFKLFKYLVDSKINYDFIKKLIKVLKICLYIVCEF